MLYKNYYIVFDLETGGLWAHNNPIVEIALIVLDSEMKEIERYENFIKPYKDLNGEILRIEQQALQANGIKLEEILEKGIDAKTLFKDLINIFKKYKYGKWGKPILVGHNASNFDSAFLEYLFNLYEEKGKTGQCPLYRYVEKFIFDTLAYARLRTGNIEVENYQLGTVCKGFEIELIDAHRAMVDTEANAELFKIFVKEIRGGKVEMTSSNDKKIKFREIFQF